MEDRRYKLMKERLESLTTEELKRIESNFKLICFDTHNYDEEKEKYCPLAVAINLHETIKEPTDLKIKKELSKRFKPINVMKGVVGNFYTRNRRTDLLTVCREILKDRN